jgi:hypothetical protein
METSAMPTAHATVGTITAIAAVCILLAAGTSVLPEKFGVAKFLIWMRRVQGFWWVVLLLAFASYVRLSIRDLLRK